MKKHKIEIHVDSLEDFSDPKVQVALWELIQSAKAMRPMIHKDESDTMVHNVCPKFGMRVTLFQSPTHHAMPE